MTHKTRYMAGSNEREIDDWKINYHTNAMLIAPMKPPSDLLHQLLQAQKKKQKKRVKGIYYHIWPTIAMKREIQSMIYVLLFSIGIKRRFPCQLVSSIPGTYTIPNFIANLLFKHLIEHSSNHPFFVIFIVHFSPFVIQNAGYYLTSYRCFFILHQPLSN